MLLREFTLHIVNKKYQALAIFDLSGVIFQSIWMEEYSCLAPGGW